MLSRISTSTAISGAGGKLRLPVAERRFWQDQFSSLYALDTIGISYYNAAQLILRHPTSHGLNVDFSYTFSKSIDMGSDTERGTEFNQIQGGPNGGNLSNIINTWNPSLNRGRLRL